MSLPRAIGALAAAVALLAPAGAAAKPPIDFHDARYCEILVLTGEVPDATVTVFNTIGLNDCPPAKWEAIDAGSLASELGAKAVILNGPRHFLMDSATGNPGPVRSFDGLRMREVATIPIRTAAELVQSTYTERTIARHNTWTWEAGRRVYELLAPDGSNYVMQSYSQIRDPSLTIGQLRSLGGRLALPTGWSYRTRVLKRDLTLRAHGAATIVQDDLTNTYQRLPRRSTAERHRVDVAGVTRTTGSPAPQTLEDQGTVSGDPFGDGTVDVVVKLADGQATGTFRIDADRGSAFGTVAMTYVITGNEIDFTGTATFTGGTGEYRGITGDVPAHDHNTLDGQNGTITLNGFVDY
ncbi:MAG: hypothetical protein QOI10_1577 [Solirubrobacterales bacterium]|jgi:hypothetical protein|nr:hypothetical protein [Solirubrobacterales bacterium]